MVQLGHDSRLYVNTGTYEAPTWTEIDLARQVTIRETRDKVDATSRTTARQGYRAYLAGLAEVGFDFECLVPSAGTTNAAFTALLTALRNGTTADIVAVEDGAITTDDLEAMRVICTVEDGARTEPLNDVVTRSFTTSFANQTDQDAPQYGTTSGGEFVPEGS
jgi:hypothetical protein